MKKIALVGTSNSIMKNGYGQFLQELLPGQVDILGLGGCSSITAVFSLLKYDIVDKYEYVVFDFCFNEYYFEKNKTINKYLQISYWVFVFNKLRTTKTTPIFLLLPNPSHDRATVKLYIKMAKLFNVEFLDISQRFVDIPRNELFLDDNHFTEKYQKEIAKSIVDATERTKRPIRYVHHMKDINFYISKHKLCYVRKNIGTR